MRIMKKLLSLLLLLVIIATGKAQKTSAWEDPGVSFSRAMELFDREKYAAAQSLFVTISLRQDLVNSEMKTLAEYHAAECAFKLKNMDAGTRLNQFIIDHPTSSKVSSARFNLGRYYFDSSQWKMAKEQLAIVDPVDLPVTVLPEYFFKLGYCQMQTKETRNAMKHFGDIKDAKSPYSQDASFYYGYLAYNEGLYETALTEFKKVADLSQFSESVPFYIAQIYYKQERYEELLSEGTPLIEKSTGAKKSQIARLCADASFKMSRWSEAIRFMEMYRSQNKGKVDRRDAYLLGYSAYQLQDYTKAKENFELVTDRQDTLAQNAFYHLGDCYIKTGSKQFAQKAFLDAYKLAYDQVSKENALFNYAKLSYELASDPYNEAITALRKYVDEFPGSPRTDEAYQFLVNLALITKNYSAALQALDNIRIKDNRTRAARQKITYYKATSLFNDKKYSEAIKLYKEISTQSFDPDIRLQALYWSAEASYRLGLYSQANSGYVSFLATKGALDRPEYILALYGNGYAYYKVKNYDQAITEFRKFLSNTAKKDPQMVTDAQLRLADCYFLQRNLSEATAWYEKAGRSGGFDADYALFQLGLAKGVQRDYPAKISTLQRLITDYSKSPYADDAEYEIALTELIQDKPDASIGSLSRLLSNYPNSSMKSRALLRRGIIYYNVGENDKALTDLKQVVSGYPKTPESKEALQTISNIYVEMNNVQEYLTYLRNVPSASDGISKQDSLIYIAAEGQYLKGECSKSVPGFTDYLTKYPKGQFSQSARYYRADCLYRSGETEKALPDFVEVATGNESRFLENALARASEILFKKEEYQKALSFYTRLEKRADNKYNILDALQGMMRCYLVLQKPDSALLAAQKLLSAEKVTADQLVEAHLSAGRASLAMGNTTLAEREFNITRNLNQAEPAAQAAYWIAYIRVGAKQWKEAERAAYEVINNYPDYDLWRVKSFLLLADVYANTGNVYQARQTLQSIIDNYEGEEIKSEAKQMLSKLPATETTTN